VAGSENLTTNLRQLKWEMRGYEIFLVGHQLLMKEAKGAPQPVQRGLNCGQVHKRLFPLLLKAGSFTSRF